MRAICRNPQIALDLAGNMRLSFDVLPESKDCRYDYDKIASLERIEVTADKEKRKRSLDSNAYAWVLIGKLAAVLHVPKEEVYRQAIREIGDNFEIVPVKDEAVERWRRNWESGHLGWISDIVGPSKMPGYTNTINYYGSSTYDTRQMSALIDCIVAECKEQGIETMTPDELENLKARWAEHERQTGQGV